MKKLLDVLRSRFEMVEERINKLKDISIEIIKSEEKKKSRENNQSPSTCGILSYA